MPLDSGKVESFQGSEEAGEKSFLGAPIVGGKKGWMLGSGSYICIYIYTSGQIIATSHEFSLQMVV